MIRILPSMVSGRVRVPGSKSFTHRALVLSALAGGGRLRNALVCDDTAATAECLTALSVEVEPRRGELVVSGSPAPATRPLDAGPSGSTARFVTALAALLDGETELHAAFSFRRRPIAGLAACLRRLGARVALDRAGSTLRVRGPVVGGAVEVPVRETSQFLSALLLTLPTAPDETHLRTRGRHVSKHYVDLTLAQARDAGLRIRRSRSGFSFEGGQTPKRRTHHVPSDASSAGYLFAAAAITGGRVHIDGLRADVPQADLAILEGLRRFGARVTRSGDGVTVEGRGLEAARIDVRDAPDSFPTLCAVASVARGTSVIRGAPHLVAKESNRVAAMASNLRKAGITATSLADGLRIEGGAPRPFTVRSFSDHRIAMACSLLGLSGAGGVRVPDPGVVRKSYPGFFQDLASLGAKVVPA